jgi:hypothetical protein
MMAEPLTSGELAWTRSSTLASFPTRRWLATIDALEVDVRRLDDALVLAMEDAERLQVERDRLRAVVEALAEECDRSNEGWRQGDYDTVKVYVDRPMFEKLAAALTEPEDQ